MHLQCILTLFYLTAFIYGFDFDSANLRRMAEVYFYFEGNNGVKGKIYMGHLRRNESESQTQDTINDKIQLENIEDDRYNKKFVDYCLSIHKSTSEHKCPYDKPFCLKWRTNQDCIGAVKRSLLMNSLMKFCDNNKGHEDCAWYEKPGNYKTVDSLTKWLSRDAIRNIC